MPGGGRSEGVRRCVGGYGEEPGPTTHALGENVQDAAPLAHRDLAQEDVLDVPPADQCTPAGPRTFLTQSDPSNPATMNRSPSTPITATGVVRVLPV